MQDEKDVADETLMQGVANRNGTALEALALRHGARLLGYLRHLGVKDLDDVLQETWLAVWRYAATYEARASVRTWLYRVARSAAQRYARRPAGAPTQFAQLDDELALGVMAGWGAGASRQGLADAQLVRTVVAQLQEADREMLFLVDMEGLTLSEVQALVGESLAACKSRLHRARLRFMAALRVLEQEGLP